MILSAEAIQKAVFEGGLGITGFQEGNTKGASYTFTFASQIRIPKKGNVVSVEGGAEFSEVEMGTDGYILRPNEFILGVTEEKLTLNGKFGCFLSARGSCAQIGLNILMSSTFAEPDTDNKITLEIHNASSSSILLKPGLKIVKGIFMRVE